MTLIFYQSDLAISILESYPNLADKRQENGMTALNLLASKTFSFRSMWFATMDFVPWHTMKILAYHCIVPNEFDYETAGDVENPRDFNISKLKGALISKLISACDWIKEIDDTKQKHVAARKLAKKLIEKEKNWIDYPNCENIAQQKKNRVIDPLIQATKQCIIEIVEEILENFPHAANTVDDENGHNILHIAAEQKNLVLYDYLQKTVNHADRMMLDIDYHGNTVLHIAASQHYQGLSVFGPAKSMTWEVFWFKRVQDDCHPSFLYHRNYDGKTAQEVFEKNHIEMRKEAEKAAKDMNSGLMLVSTIIGSVNYAALFTLPGGLDQISGLPIFTNRTATERSDLQLFSYYIGGSLVAALLALGTQLSIQLSRFGNNEFLISLPFKYLLASTALFYATSFSVTACYQTYILETVFEKSFYWAMLISFILMIHVYIDSLYPTFSYMYEVIRHYLTYRWKKM
ncbi:uncharacterized protein LOC114301852 [Camellia sinensis]|uniref:uncharacterized protein LOC114301852 n=1 Tax=Camellia sinensis TaxID=4442 RepID=UPI001035E943|nr:uncharacterized protein LOC114301852 [Camellia sinensis]